MQKLEESVHVQKIQIAKEKLEMVETLNQK
jgi:hypothetical protein